MPFDNPPRRRPTNQPPPSDTPRGSLVPFAVGMVVGAIVTMVATWAVVFANLTKCFPAR
jgi:hypothetical protein